MTRRGSSILLAPAAALALGLLLCATRASALPASLAGRLEAIAREAGGTVGLSAVHVESGRRVSLRGDERFPMMSVYKLPIGLAVLQLADEGTLSLDARERFEAKDLRLGRSPLAERWTAPAVTLTVRELLDLMVSNSDNSACDRLLALAGGGAAVTARLRAWGIDGIRVDRPEGLLAVALGGFVPPPADAWTLALLKAKSSEVTGDARRAAVAAYLADPRDTSTPDAMTRLLARVHRRDLVKPASADLLMRWLVETPTTPRRMRGGLPPGATDGHKSGTSDDDPDGGTPVVNDVGIITLPGGGHVLLAMFVKGSAKPLDAIEAVIARLTRAVCDEWSAGSGAPAVSR
jgi:beta-lactamase class A